MSTIRGGACSVKIYFDGDSWTHGGELDKKDREHLRYSRLVSKELDAEEYNFSECGISNYRIVRRLLIDHDISEYDIAIIQMTYPERLEYYDKKWKSISIVDTPLVHHNLLPPWEKKKKFLEKKGIDHKFWTQYYKEIYDEYYGYTYEQIHATTIRNHCELNNVPLILMTNNNLFADNKNFDLELERPRYPKFKGGHPTEEGHKIIANDLLRLL